MEKCRTNYSLRYLLRSRVSYSTFAEGNGGTNDLLGDVHARFVTTAKFMSYADYKVTEIDVSLVNLGGNNGATIRLLTATHAGAPGKI
jgi:hypothetical protein